MFQLKMSPDQEVTDLEGVTVDNLDIARNYSNIKRMMMNITCPNCTMFCCQRDPSCQNCTTFPISPPSDRVLGTGMEITLIILYSFILIFGLISNTAMIWVVLGKLIILWGPMISVVSGIGF